METLGEVLREHQGSIDQVSVQYNADVSTWQTMCFVFQNPSISATSGLGWVTVEGHSIPSYIELEDRYETDLVVFYGFDYGGVKIQVTVRKAELIGDLVIERRPNGAILLRRSEGVSWFVLSEEELARVEMD